MSRIGAASRVEPAIKTSLTAIDLRAKGKVLWQQKKDSLIGGVLAAAGGLVFTGEGKGDGSAFDVKTGERLWGYNCGAGVNAPPLSYSAQIVKASDTEDGMGYGSNAEARL